MTKDEVELEARLQAMEYFIAHFINVTYGAAHASSTDIERSEAELAATLEAFAVPGIGAAMSDHVSAEIQSAVQKLLADARSMREMKGSPAR